MNKQFRWVTLAFFIVMLTVNKLYASESNAQFVGDFSHIESSTGEHCDGYSVTLWEKGKSLVGYLAHHRGLCGDPPWGLIEDVQYSSLTGNLMFKVKILGDGFINDLDSKTSWHPSKDIVIFKGKLKTDNIEGEIFWNGINLQRDAHGEKVHLMRVQENGSPYRIYEDFVERWKKQIEPQWNPLK